MPGIVGSLEFRGIKQDFCSYGVHVCSGKKEGQAINKQMNKITLESGR